MKKEDTIKAAIFKKTWKTPQMNKIDVSKNTQGKRAVVAGEFFSYAPS